MPLIKRIDKKDYLLGIWKITENVDLLNSMIINDLDVDELKMLKSFKSKKRQCEWLAVRMLLRTLLGRYQRIFYDQYSKPYLEDLNISITHTQKYAGVIISKYNCAVDIEKISSKAKRIKNKFLSSEEQAFCNTDYCYTMLWSAKETAYKFYGKKELSFVKNLIVRQLDREKIFIEIKKEKLLLSLPIKVLKFNEHILTYCVQ